MSTILDLEGTIDEVFQNFTVYCEITNNPMEIIVPDDLKGYLFELMLEYYGTDSLPLKALDPDTQIVRQHVVQH